MRRWFLTLALDAVIAALRWLDVAYLALWHAHDATRPPYERLTQ